LAASDLYTRLLKAREQLKTYQCSFFALCKGLDSDLVKVCDNCPFILLLRTAKRWILLEKEFQKDPEKPNPYRVATEKGKSVDIANIMFQCSITLAPTQNGVLQLLARLDNFGGNSGNAAQTSMGEAAWVDEGIKITHTQ
jgi:hypothetical protein